MISLIIHGGAWDIPDDLLEPHRKGCTGALRVGWDLLQNGGSAVDAVERTIRCMEDDGSFDAGVGSHLNADGIVELDASIMNGRSLRCGAVAAVHRIRNPITAARKVMEESEYILLVGSGAEHFAVNKGIPLCQLDDLITDREFLRWKAAQGIKNFSTKDSFRKARRASDTVGAVALDVYGDICVGTSTGGTFNKHPGRVGDSPLIGCGSYADNTIGGVSTTGWGEAIIKVVMAKTVIDMMDHKKLGPSEAANEGIRILSEKADGYGGVIALSSRGEVGISFNTPRMARAYMTSEMAMPFIAV